MSDGALSAVGQAWLMSASYLFEDVFEVQEANPDGKFFDKGAWLLLCIERILVDKLPTRTTNSSRQAQQ